MCKKKLCILCLIIACTLYLPCQIVHDSQLLKSDSWIYEALSTLSLESQDTLFLDTKPISVGELKFYFSQIDFEKLSDSGKSLYQQVEKFLFSTNYFWKNYKKQQEELATRIDIGLKINPELYLKTNKNIPSSINYYFKDWFLTLPIIFGISENVTLQLDVIHGKNFEDSKNPNSYSNIPFSDSEREYEFPRFAYGNIGAYFKDWGFSATFGREGFSIGDTKLGSIIYNSTFETDFYSTFSTYSPYFKYNLVASQAGKDKFIFLHNFNLKIFSNLKISFTEGCLRNGPFELRFLNPSMLLHNFYAGFKYGKDDPLKEYDLDNHYCSYMGITIDFYPIKNARIYALWAQTELQTSGELTNSYGKMLPDGYGLQLGFDYVIPIKKEKYFFLNIESLFTTPYLYVKQNPDWSMITFRDDYKTSKDVATWIGTPFGPDTFAISTSFILKQPRLWTFGFEYLFLAKGEINSDTLLQTKEGFPAYYPYVEYCLGYISQEEAIKKARQFGLTGTVQYQNDFSILGEYQFNNNICFAAEGTYSLIFNYNHEKGNFQDNFELKLSLSYAL